MGLSLPSELTEPMSWVGLEWPQADEELLAEAGAAWIRFGSELAQISGPASASASGVWSQNTGDTSQAFETWWTARDGPPKRLGDDAAAAFLIGGALIAFSIVTLMTKISIIVQLITLLILIAQAVITAFFTFGAAAAETPGIIATSRMVIRRLLTKILQHVQGIVRDILEKARNLLRLGRRILRRQPNIPGRQVAAKYRTIELDEAFRYETDPSHPDNWWGWRVRRLSDTEKEEHRIFVDGDGLLRNARDGHLFDTTSASTLHYGGDGRAIFVQDAAGNLYASVYQERGVFHHSTLASGGPVAAAGELQVTRGHLELVTSKSGHYEPGEAEMQQFVDEMAGHGVTNFPVYDFDDILMPLTPSIPTP